MIQNLNSRPTANIQQFQRLSSAEQGIEEFAITATTGQDPATALRGAAPQAFQNRQPLSSEIQAGRGAGPTIRLGA